MEAVNEIELGQIDDIHPHPLAHPHRDRLVHVEAGRGVDRIDLVLSVEVGVECVEHHDELVGRGTRRLGRRIDDEGAVEPLMHVALQRISVTVIEVDAERVGVELVYEPITRHHLMGRQRPIHLWRVPAVKVDGVRMSALVDEVDPDTVASPGANRRPWHLPVVGPSREEDTRCDLDLAVYGKQLVLAEERAVLAWGLPVEARPLVGRQVREVPGSEKGHGVERLGRDAADRPHGVAEMVRTRPLGSCLTASGPSRGQRDAPGEGTETGRTDPCAS